MYEELKGKTMNIPKAFVMQKVRDFALLLMTSI